MNNRIKSVNSRKTKMIHNILIKFSANTVCSSAPLRFYENHNNGFDYNSDKEHGLENFFMEKILKRRFMKIQ